jgi:hypothetical protein
MTDHQQDQIFIVVGRVLGYTSLGAACVLQTLLVWCLQSDEELPQWPVLALSCANLILAYMGGSYIGFCRALSKALNSTIFDYRKSDQ